MTLIKSLLLGSAAGIVAVATAQAADLPTRKAAPVEYVRVCNVGGITGWTLPGSDTCVKFSGYITAQFTGGNLETQYNYGSVGDLFTSGTPGVGPTITGVPAAAAGALGDAGWNRQSQHPARSACSQRGSAEYDLLPQQYRLVDPRQLRVRYGLQHGLGPLIGHVDLNVDVANGLDPLQGSGTQHRLSEHRLI